MNIRKILLLFVFAVFLQHTSIEASYKRFISNYFNRTKTFFRSLKNRIPRKTSLKQRNFFSNLFKKFKNNAIKKPSKKIIATTGVVAGTLLSTTLKDYVAHAYGPQDQKEILNSLSYKFAQQKTVAELQTYFNKIAADWIKDPEFAKALKREQKAQEKGNFVAYHAMPEAVFDGLAVYTDLFDEINNITEKKDCVYLRTFNALSKYDYAENQEPIKSLSFVLSHNKPDDKSNEGRERLVSLSPWLFQDNVAESALGSKIIGSPTKSIMWDIARDICKLYNVENPVCKREIQRLLVYGIEKSAYLKLSPVEELLASQERIFLQIIFDKSQNSSLKKLEKSLEKNPAILGKLNPRGFYVGDNPGSIFPNLYWSLVYGYPSNSSNPFSRRHYDGPKLLKKMKSPYTIFFPYEAQYAQVRLVVTTKFQEERAYTTDIINIGGEEKLKNYENTKKELVKKVKNIIRKYQ